MERGKVLTIFAVLVAVVLVGFFAVSYIGNAYVGQMSLFSAYCKRLLRALASAMEEYKDTHGSYPPVVTMGPDGRPLYNWRVPLLTYLDDAGRGEGIDLGKPWNSPENEAILGQEELIRKFYCPWYWRRDASQLVEYVLVVRATEVLKSGGYCDYRIVEMPATGRHFADPSGGYFVVFGDWEDFLGGLYTGGRYHCWVIGPQMQPSGASEAAHGEKAGRRR